MAEDEAPEDQALYERIWLAQRDGKVEIGTELRALNKPGSPIFKWSENLLPWVAFVALTLVGLKMAGWIGAVAVAAGMTVLMMTTFSFLVLSRVRKRAKDYALSGRVGFETLWNGGGLTLRLTGDAASEINSPDDDWQTFARERLAFTKGDAEA